MGKILGLVAAPLVGNAATVPSLQKRAVQCNAVSQPDSQSEAHTAPSSAVGLTEPLDCQKSKRIWRSKFGSDPSCVAARAPAHTAHPHSAFQFQLASSQCPFSTGEPPEAVTPERHSAFLRPELFDNLGDKSVEFVDGFGEKSVEYVEGDRLPHHMGGDT